jgi:hypothetical protein
MKIKILALLLLFGCNLVMAQTADDIINKYFENTGGNKYAALQGLKMTGALKQGNMDLPAEIIQLKDGKQIFVLNVQGQKFVLQAYDGTNLWATNQMTMKGEKSDAETTENFKSTLADFPDPFYNYKAKGYTVELLGKETVEGSETFKIKLTKKPLSVDGKKVDNISFYYFDVDNYVPILTESDVHAGPAKGMVQQIKMSDYQEVDGMLFPFSISQGVKGGGASSIVVTKIEVNPKVDETVFALPKQ